jgi:hypothetical protein
LRQFGHYKPLCAYIDCSFLDPNSSARRPENLERAPGVWGAAVTADGYAPDLNDAELVAVGRDPFLIAYAFADASERYVVSFENSAPTKQRANRKVPDVCKDLGVECVTLFELIKRLDFTTDWHP